MSTVGLLIVLNLGAWWGVLIFTAACESGVPLRFAPQPKASRVFHYQLPLILRRVA